jgi:hypothetical protein
MELMKEKQEFFELKVTRGRQRFEITDIVPLVSHTWIKRVGNIENANKAIIQHYGWGPLNFVLLDHPEVRKTVHKW